MLERSRNLEDMDPESGGRKLESSGLDKKKVLKVTFILSESTLGHRQLDFSPQQLRGGYLL
jgi:hypothetical protein